jgi:hypothetical protein
VSRQARPVDHATRVAWSPLYIAAYFLVIAAFLVLELLGFATADDSRPTFSQLVKAAEGRFGVGSRVVVSLLLVGSAVVLILHWSVELF